MTRRAETLVLKPGSCRVCGCNELTACAIEIVDENGDTTAIGCSWVDSARTLCSNPDCIAEVPLEELEKAMAAGR